VRRFGSWLVRSPIRLLELCAGLVLLAAAALLADGRGAAAFLYFFGALLLFLTLYSYLTQERPR
jgi:hypothetical protein